MKSRTGRHILSEALLIHGVKTIFCGPRRPEDAMPAALRNSGFHIVEACTEAGAALMAEAAGALSGRAGVCFVQRGPGACQAALAVQAAMERSTPLLLLVEQVATGKMGRAAAGEIDCRLMFGAPVAKWAVQIDHARDIPRVIREAFEAATTGRPGPVVIALPEDILGAAEEYAALAPQAAVHFGPRHNDLGRLLDILGEAKKPLVIAGGSTWTAETIALFAAFCARARLPVITGFGRQDIFPSGHDCYAGALGPSPDPRLLTSAAEADVILAIGTRLGEITTQGYTIPALPLSGGAPQQRLVHVYPDSTELNRVYRAELALHSDIAGFVRALQPLDVSFGSWQAWTETLRAQHVAWTAAAGGGILAALLGSLPPDSVLVNDAGNGSSPGWPERFIPCNRPFRLLTAPQGAAGYGVPAGIAASLALPERLVVSLIDAAGFLKTGQELITARLEKTQAIFLVFNDGEAQADIAALAKAYGVEAATVRKMEEFLPVFRKAAASQTATVIELRMDKV